MSFPKDRDTVRALARKGGLASAKKATERRLAKWAEWGVDPVVGQRIYDAGYACRVAQERRQPKQDATDTVTRIEFSYVDDEASA